MQNKQKKFQKNQVLIPADDDHMTHVHLAWQSGQMWSKALLRLLTYALVIESTETCEPVAKIKRMPYVRTCLE